ncbi:non-hydrolyzing UDP-N-acetylglucosamine 2-epimerase [Chloroflexus aggregans]|uniref:UDP-N-acetylglucosamine 2-epimerase n=1 Tax=Chloroflexus aggregans (strain MD-66 / DSM 9485) TaxID=326427 RepID=B8GBP9_CHLAD|nr:UDP-N-acetylglucosamine 2-epimerase (non-hydrolyzing) [Chloroflexus aggregans]ACL24866.1 UDP-N-acetylglucosamine 2-epimerase [Chloroflexus aggregans DSM 9485]
MSKPLNIVTIVGARPQFIKAAAISRALRTRHREVLVHTGQHYDANMSAIFFDELGIPPPDVNLAVGSAGHGAQTGAMLAKIEEVLLAEHPDWVLVYGDTNSTLAGALAAAKLRIPVAHVEAGLRSFNRAMPEEINRVLTDHISDLLLCPSQTAIDNLAREGITRGVMLVGDVMADALRLAVERADDSALAAFGVHPGSYALATVHRAENTDDPLRLQGILTGLTRLDMPVVFPVHPRTRRAIAALGWMPPAHVHLIEPVGYLDMIALMRSSCVVLTDSGGIQKEAYWLGVPCITLRDETEWVETVEYGWNTLVGVDPERIVAAAHRPRPTTPRPILYGDGHAAERCVAAIERGSKVEDATVENSGV